MRLLETFINNRVHYIRFDQENPSEIKTIISNRIHNFEMNTEACALRDQFKPIIKAINCFKVMIVILQTLLIFAFTYFKTLFSILTKNQCLN